jgi:Zinc knuckle
MSFSIESKEFIHYQDNNVNLVTQSEKEIIINNNMKETIYRLSKFENYPPIDCTFIPIPHHLLAVRDHYKTTINYTNHETDSNKRNTNDTQKCFRATRSRKLKQRRNGRRAAPSQVKKPKYTREEAEAVILKDQQVTRACLNCDQPGHKSRQCPSLTCTFCKAAWPSIDTPGRHLFVNCPIRNIPIKDQYSFMQVK